MVATCSYNGMSIRTHLHVSTVWHWSSIPVSRVAKHSNLPRCRFYLTKTSAHHLFYINAESNTLKSMSTPYLLCTCQATFSISLEADSFFKGWTAEGTIGHIRIVNVLSQKFSDAHPTTLGRISMKWYEYIGLPPRNDLTFFVRISMFRWTVFSRWIMLRTSVFMYESKY